MNSTPPGKAGLMVSASVFHAQQAAVKQAVAVEEYFARGLAAGLEHEHLRIILDQEQADQALRGDRNWEDALDRAARRVLLELSPVEGT